MLEVRIEKPDKEVLTKMGVFDWPIWQKEISTFDWFYDERETCYILEGKVRVEPAHGEGVAVEFGPGDLVTFPKGLKCVWKIEAPVKKHYTFG